MLLDIERGVKGYGKPVREIFRDLNRSDYGTLTPFLDSLGANEGESFADGWCNALDSFNSRELLFTDEEIRLLSSFAHDFGYGDADDQSKLIRTTTEYFDVSLKSAREDASKQGKLKLMLPIYAGVIVCILII